MKIDCKTVRIFAYSSTREQSNKRSGTRLKTESETGERREKFFSLASHALRVCAPRARKTHTPRFTDFFTDFEKKIDCFAVYNEDGFIAYVLMSSNGKVKMIVLCTYNLAQNRWEIYTSRSHQFKDGNVAHFGFRTASSLI